MAGPARILVVLLNYRTPELSLEALAAARTAMQGLEGEIVVVDNDSRDGSFDRLSAEVNARGWAGGETPVSVLQSGRNGGFGAGNNHGIRMVLARGPRPDLVHVLNSDALPAPDAIARLAEALAAHPEAGLAGSYIHGPEGEPHITAFRFPSILGELEGAARIGPLTRLLGEHTVPMALPELTTFVDWLAGASLMMRMDMLEEIGLFDERFFLYFEETDLCLRAARAGWRTLYVRESRVSHVGSASTGMRRWRRVPRYWYDSRLRYFVKNHGAAYAAAATAAHLAGGVAARTRAALQRRPPGDPPHFLRNLALHYLRALANGQAWRAAPVAEPAASPAPAAHEPEGPPAPPAPARQAGE